VLVDGLEHARNSPTDRHLGDHQPRLPDDMEMPSRQWMMMPEGGNPTSIGAIEHRAAGELLLGQLVHPSDGSVSVLRVRLATDRPRRPKTRWVTWFVSRGRRLPPNRILAASTGLGSLVGRVVGA
jgi:hypothetical protein